MKTLILGTRTSILVLVLCFPSIVLNTLLHRRFQEAKLLFGAGNAGSKGSRLKAASGAAFVPGNAERVKITGSTSILPHHDLPALKPGGGGSPPKGHPESPSGTSTFLPKNAGNPNRKLGRLNQFSRDAQNYVPKDVHNDPQLSQLNNVISGNLAAFRSKDFQHNLAEMFLITDNKPFLRGLPDPEPIIPESFRPLLRSYSSGSDFSRSSSFASSRHLDHEDQVAVDELIAKEEGIAKKRLTRANSFVLVREQPPKTEQELEKDFQEAQKTVTELGRILSSLSGEQRLRQTIDSKFIINEFEKSWLESLTPAERLDPNLLAQKTQVEKTLPQLVKLTKEKETLKLRISDEAQRWTASEKELINGVQEAFFTHLQGTLGETINGEFTAQNWQRDVVTQKFRPMVDNFIKKGDPAQRDLLLKQFQIKRGLTSNNKLKNALLDKLVTPPKDSVDPESKFINEFLSSTYYVRFKSDPNNGKIDVNTQVLVDLKFQYHVINPIKEAAAQITNDYLKTRITAVATDQKLMKAQYHETVVDLIFQSENIEAEFFEKYTGVQLSSSQIYQEMQNWNGVWKVDLDAFKKSFENKLSYAEYRDLYLAASVSKSAYSDVLKGIQDKREIVSFKQIEALPKKTNGASDKEVQKSLGDLLQRLKDKGILQESEFTGLSEGATHDASRVIQSLRNKLEIDLFDKLETGSIPLVHVSSTQASIKQMLDKLTAGGILTQEEKRYLDGLFAGGYSEKIEDLVGLKEELRRRIIDLASSDFPKIERNDAFISETLNKKIEAMTKYREERVDNSLRDSQYSEVYQDLRAQEIKQALDREATNEFWAGTLWKDYFHRNLRSDRLIKLSKIKRPQKPKLSEDATKQGKELIDSLLQILAEDGKHGGNSRITPTFTHNSEYGEAVSVELNKIMDARNLILIHKPLKVGDERLKSTPFRYLKKETIDEWNTAVQQISQAIPKLNENIFLRNLKDQKIQQSLRSVQEYNALIAEHLQKVNDLFTVSKASKPERTLWELRGLPTNFSH